MKTEKVYFSDDFIGLTKGDRIRLLPFGKIVKNGKAREITPELAASFSLPHFKPPLKLGSHDDSAPAGGVITSLEVGTDGLYGVPEWTEKGRKVFDDGDYHYHSPEVIWSSGGYENSETGETIPGPLIVGLALLHTPHLGERAALYSVENSTENDMEVVEVMENETVSVPKTLWEKIEARFMRPENDNPESDPEPQDNFDAVKQDRDDLAAKLEALESKNAKDALNAEIVSELQNQDRFGANFIELKDADEAAMVLAGMTPEHRSWVMTKFAAYIARINTGEILDEKGSTGDGADADPMGAFDAKVKAVMDEDKIDFNSALDKVVASHPETASAAYARMSEV